MDGNRFDNLAVSLVDAESSRRSLLARLIGGGFAAVLAALGIGGFSAEDADAKKRGGRKRGGRKKAKTCEQKCNKKGKRKRGGKGKGGGRRRKKSSKSKAACLAKCQPAGTSSAITSNQIFTGGTTPTGPGGTCTLGTTADCVAGSTCVLDAAGTQICVTSDQILTCTSSAQCPTGFCASVGICLPCGTLGTSICGQESTQTCCAAGAECHPTLDICLA
jgi:hypothetical protein